VERELLFSGIGGQGIQLCAHVLAAAAIAEGKDVQLFGSYGGMMRGGNTDATLVVSDDRVEAPPTVGSAWCAVLMHHEFAAPTLDRLRADGVAFVNSTVCEGLEAPGRTVVGVPATALAAEAGNVIAAGMVMLGALVAATGIVGTSSLHDAAAASLPPYRTQHIELNDRALVLGEGAASELVAPAWPARAGVAL